MANGKSSYPTLEERVKEVLSQYEIKALGNGVFEMRHPKKEEAYTVNAKEGKCTCPAGQNGKQCKHLAAAKELMVKNGDEMPLHEASRILYWVADADIDKLLSLSDKRKAKVLKAIAIALKEVLDAHVQREMAKLFE